MNYGFTMMYRILNCYYRTRFWKQIKNLGYFSRYRVFEPRPEPGISYYEFRNATHCASPLICSGQMLKENFKRVENKSA